MKGRQVKNNYKTTLSQYKGNIAVRRSGQGYLITKHSSVIKLTTSDIRQTIVAGQ